MADEAEEYEHFKAQYIVVPNKAAQKYTMHYEFKVRADEIAIMDDIAKEEASKKLEKLRNELSGSSVTLDKIVHEREVPLTAEE